MTLTVFRAGNSWAVTLPREMAKKLNLAIGKKVIPKVADGNIVLQPVKSTGEVSEDFKKRLYSFEKRYSKALKELASK